MPSALSTNEIVGIKVSQICCVLIDTVALGHSAAPRALPFRPATRLLLAVLLSSRVSIGPPTHRP